MGYCCADCGDTEHSCAAWDGTGRPQIGIKPNHNLVPSCPNDIKRCEYRKEKVKSHPIKV